MVNARHYSIYHLRVATVCANQTNAGIARATYNNYISASIDRQIKEMVHYSPRPLPAGWTLADKRGLLMHPLPDLLFLLAC